MEKFKKKILIMRFEFKVQLCGKSAQLILESEKLKKEWFYNKVEQNPDTSRKYVLTMLYQ